MKYEILSSISIRELTSIEELEQVRKFEATIWSMEESVPVNQTIAAVKNGGFVLGAFNKETLIGFQYSFPGFDGKNVYLCSHSLGIHPEFQKFGIGAKLKYAQKELAIKKSYKLITWTYDPLETVNANLNLHKLRAVCSTYIENAYGDMEDSLNAGLPTDRFYVEWWLSDEEGMNKPHTDSKCIRAIKTHLKSGYLSPEEVDLSQTVETIAVPVPGNFQEIKKNNFSLALEWRKATRKVFSHYFKKGWTAIDLIKDPDIDHQYLYFLSKN